MCARAVVGSAHGMRRSLRADTRGSHSVEHLVLVGLVALGAAAGVRYFGNRIDDKVIEQASCIANLAACAGGSEARTTAPGSEAAALTHGDATGPASPGETVLVRQVRRANSAPTQEPAVATKMNENIDGAIALRRRGHDIPEHLLPTDHPWVGGNATEYLIDGPQVFPRILGDLEKANDSIHISHFAIGNDKLGAEVGKILTDKARAGVEVRVLLDPAGSDDLLKIGKTERMLKEWEAAGVQVIRNYHINPLRRAEMLNHIEHRKMFIIDGKVAYTGGMGIQEKYRSEWHDVMIRAQGEATRQMQVDYLKTWQHLGGRIDQKGGTDADLKKRFFPEAGRPGDVSLRGLSQIPGEAPVIRETYLREINAAKKSFWIENPYFTDARVLDALEAAARRGVDVRVVLPGKTDMPLTQWAARGEYDRLMKAGIKIYEYDGMTHAKVAVRDGEWATVGSSNLDSLSLNHLYEWNYETSDPKLSDEVRTMIERDTRRSKEITPKDTKGVNNYIYKLLDLPFVSYWL